MKARVPHSSPAVADARQGAVPGPGPSARHAVPVPSESLSARVLVVDGDERVRASLSAMLAEQGYAVASARGFEEALERVEASVRESPSPHGPGAVGVVICDADTPRAGGGGLGGGIELLRRLREAHPTVVPIVMTGFGKLAEAVQAVRLGASDYLTKPMVDEELRLAVERALHHHALVAENRSLKAQLDERFGVGNLVGSDYRMQKVYDLIEAVADSRSTVLISGESGTGKTVVARAIHTLSGRSAKPFVTFACGSIPETLLESELFGHVKGAFTGADTDKPGRLLAAEGGTLFIDEINSATPALQLKLLRVLQERAFEPLGSAQTREVDVRFVIATNADLAELVREGRFREDLYYRINVVNLALPALRDRDADVPLLAEHFLREQCEQTGKRRRLGPEAVEALRRHAWPGNVRELENAIERAVLLSKELMIGLEDLPEAVRGEAGSPRGLASSSDGGRGLGADRQALDAEARELGLVRVSALQNGWTPTPLDEALAEPERQILLAALAGNDWNRSRAAEELGINRTTLYKKMKHLGIQPESA